MQKIERDNYLLPRILQSDAYAHSRQAMFNYFMLTNERRAQTSAPLSSEVLDESDIQRALKRLFHGRCAFCESQAETQVHRFRPPENATPFQQSDRGHLYYAWLADAWENLYPICKQCQPREPNYFPVRGKRAPLPELSELESYVLDNTGQWHFPINEKALLLDPCESDNFHLAFNAQLDGRLLPLSPAGEETIATFNLNRPELVGKRAQKHQAYLKVLIRALAEKDSRSLNPLFDFKKLEFGGSWYLLLRRLALLIGSNKGTKPVLSPTRIVRLFKPLFLQDDIALRMEDILNLLHQNDSSPAVMLQPKKNARFTTGFPLARIAFKNFKSLENLELILPAVRQSTDTRKPCLLILGENATGKSSILEGIALGLSNPETREKLGLEARSYLLNPQYMGGQSLPVRRLAEVTITLEDGAQRTLKIDRGRMIASDQGDFKAMPVFAYGAFRQYQHKQRMFTADRTVRNLFEGSLLGNPQAWLLKLDEVKFAMVIRALRQILSVEGEFDVVERDEGSKQCYVIHEAVNDRGESIRNRTPLSAVSSGFRSVLAMACDIIQGLMDSRIYAHFETIASSQAVVLIDEVEAHLHPRWKMQIMKGLRAAFPGVTFIATTHDPLCLRGMENNEIRVLQRVASGRHHSMPVYVETLTQLPDTSKLRVDQLLTADFFQLYSTDAPELDDRLAHIADLLANERAGQPLTAQEKMSVQAFTRDIAEAMPIGSTEAHRLVQEAVAEYLKERRPASAERMNRLKAETRRKIVNILKGDR